MANAVITSDAKKVKVVFNDASTAAGYMIAYFAREHLAEVRYTNNGYVEVLLDDGKSWQVSTNGANNTLPVDSIDAVTPTDNEHLCDMIANLIDY